METQSHSAWSAWLDTALDRMNKRDTEELKRLTPESIRKMYLCKLCSHRIRPVLGDDYHYVCPNCNQRHSGRIVQYALRFSWTACLKTQTYLTLATNYKLAIERLLRTKL